ncbi:NRDE family protein [Microbacterium sp. ANT_H45B]|uniref:NRDE family protein n=1 Tax=Microbacterium sp. ANT_H45B TaxID=2597346 RepID=UPI0011EC744B|nr:NRDE family protein [Microbacterium sp. ANT_H45B]KAA0962278.1 NRDE family protein [Microbacterium sp. ANT_H45B]
MCTVVIDVADSVTARLLAVRDEDPQREWDAPGEWWPDAYPGVSGIRDRRAGGAWLATDPAAGRLAVLLNRADVVDLAEDVAVSRGSLALESASGRSPVAPLPMHGFNLLEVAPEGARVVSWDGVELRETPIRHGVHMIAHDDLDDPDTPRIAAWLPEFRAQGATDDAAEWAADWTSLLASSAGLDPEDDRAIIRDNRPHGYPTQSLLYCLATVTPGHVELDYRALPRPGHWTH